MRVAAAAGAAAPPVPDVVFTPSGVRAEVADGTTVLDAARAAGVDLDSTCGGRGLCGRCQVVVSDPAGLSDRSSLEQEYKGRRPIEPGNRLGCQARVLAGVMIDVPVESQVHRPVVRKRIDLTGLTVDPLVTARYVVLPEPELGDERAEAELLAAELAVEWAIDDAVVDARVLPDLHAAIVDGQRGVTAVVHRDGRVLAIRPGFDEPVYGLAVDVGSTTIAAYLVDLATGEVVAGTGTMNPQIRFGEDLMSRVSYVMMNPEGVAELTRAVRGAIDAMIDELGSGLDMAPAELRARIHDLVAVGNPIMHHLLLGIDPTPLGAAPFTLAVSAPVDLRADELGLDLPRALAHVGPCIAGHVGADAAAATLNERTHRTAEPQLLIDVGTNAEIVLGTPDGTYAASSPTGPAFEGAQISSGMRATAGAIERIRIDPATLEPRFKVIGADQWSDEPGFAEAAAGLDIAGLCGSAIIEVIGEMVLTGICDRNGVILEEAAARSDRVQPDDRTFRYVIRAGDNPLAITQNDVRQIQLAGAALRAGIDLLMEHAGIDSVGDIRLAGAFGTHLDPAYALVLGLVPTAPVEAVRSVGNSSGAGAVRMLVSAGERAEVAAAVLDIVKIETATEPRFQELFVAAMAFGDADSSTAGAARGRRRRADRGRR